MKRETVIKVLKRYAKGLKVMEAEAYAEKASADAGHYKFDREAIEQAIALIEEGKE